MQGVRPRVWPHLDEQTGRAAAQRRQAAARGHRPIARCTSQTLVPLCCLAAQLTVAWRHRAPTIRSLACAAAGRNGWSQSEARRTAARCAAVRSSRKCVAAVQLPSFPPHPPTHERHDRQHRRTNGEQKERKEKEQRKGEEATPIDAFSEPVQSRGQWSARRSVATEFEAATLI